MPDHRVRFTVPYRDLGRSDIEFKVYKQPRRGRGKGRALIGTLLISRGAIEWRSRRTWKVSKIKLSWPDFDSYMLKKKDGR